jgi:hypothetical protein
LSVVYVRFRVGPDHGAGPDAVPRVLARLLARADGSTAIEDWREDAVRFVTNGQSSAPAVGPVAWWAASHAAGRNVRAGIAAEPLEQDFAAHVCVATPLHCVAGMSSVGLPPAGILRLDADEARDFAADFNRRFDGAGHRLLPTPADGLLCAFERPLLARTLDPERVLGQSIGPYLPTGRDGAVLRSLMSEIEMWLFDHPVNRRRAAAQRPPVTGLWLWGGGGALREPPSLDAWVAGEDLLLSAWPRQTDWPDSRARLGGETVVPRSGLIVITQCPDDAVWSTWESSWLAPAEASLRAGRIASIAVSAGEYRYDLGTRASRRFWRRARPWRDYFA